MFGPMTFVEGRDHTYLGLEIKVLTDNSIFINQTSYLNKVINSYVEWRVTIDSNFKLKDYVTPSITHPFTVGVCKKKSETPAV